MEDGHSEKQLWGGLDSFLLFAMGSLASLLSAMGLPYGDIHICILYDIIPISGLIVGCAKAWTLYPYARVAERKGTGELFAAWPGALLFKTSHTWPSASRKISPLRKSEFGSPESHF